MELDEVKGGGFMYPTEVRDPGADPMGGRFGCGTKLCDLSNCGISFGALTDVVDWERDIEGNLFSG